jgi:hypothetical protein
MWNEELVADCPPIDAKDPNGQCFFRLVKKFPPVEKDMESLRKRQPNIELSNGTNECIVRSLSVHSSLQSAEGIKKLPAHKRKKIVKFILENHDGPVKKTLKNDHYSWWRKRESDILTKCQLI